MKIAIVISTDDTETSWNAFRLANFTLTKKDTVKVFLLGKGVEAENIGTDKFDIKKQMESFVSAGGQMLTCGTCLKIRNSSGTELCPLSTMNDLYENDKRSRQSFNFLKNYFYGQPLSNFKVVAYHQFCVYVHSAFQPHSCK